MSSSPDTRPERRNDRVTRLRAWTEAHPRLYAARHVVLNLGGTVLAILGLRLVLGRLLPRIDVGWLPDLHAPEWLRYLDPARYLAPLFAWVQPLVDALLGWVPDVELGWAKYVVGFLVAVAVAVREARRRQRVAAESPPGTQHNDRS